MPRIVRTTDQTRLASLLVVGALLLGSCTNVDDPAVPSIDDPVADPISEQAPSTGTGNLRWRTPDWTSAETQQFGELSAEITVGGREVVYEAATDAGAGYVQNLMIELAAGTAPDVFWIPGDWLAAFVERDLLLPLRELADASSHSDLLFRRGPMTHLTYDPTEGTTGSTLWGLPSQLTTRALFVNLDLLAEAGVTAGVDPDSEETWTDADFASAIAVVGSLAGRIDGYGEPLDTGTLATWLGQARATITDPADESCTLDEPAAIAAYQAMHDRYRSGHMVSADENPLERFVAGRVGFHLGDPRTATALSRVSFAWDVVPLPEGTAGRAGWLDWGAFVVNSTTADPEGAWTLVQAVTSQSFQTETASLGHALPSRVARSGVNAYLASTFTPSPDAFSISITGSPLTTAPLWSSDWPDVAAALELESVRLMSLESRFDSELAGLCTIVGLQGE